MLSIRFKQLLGSWSSFMTLAYGGVLVSAGSLKFSWTSKISSFSFSKARRTRCAFFDPCDLQAEHWRLCSTFPSFAFVSVRFLAACLSLACLDNGIAWKNGKKSMIEVFSSEVSPRRCSCCWLAGSNGKKSRIEEYSSEVSSRRCSCCWLFPTTSQRHSFLKKVMW